MHRYFLSVALSSNHLIIKQSDLYKRNHILRRFMDEESKDVENVFKSDQVRMLSP